MAINEHSPYALVVDDEMLVRLHACDILEEAGFRFVEACDVNEALRLLHQMDGQITLLFTDVHMPGERNGFHLVQEASSRWPHLKVLVASGATTPSAGELPEGAVFVNKPFSADVIFDRLQELLPDGEQPEPLRAK